MNPDFPDPAIVDKRSEKKPVRRLLDPIDRTSEVLFGLIMALSFTCSIGAAEAGKDDVQAMLIGAIGCNIAWGLIDGIIFLLTSLTERAREIAALRAMGKAIDPEEGRAIVTDALLPVIANALSVADIERIRQKLVQLSGPPERPRLRSSDFLAAAGVALLVILATFPVVLPFIFIEDAGTALRTSNGIALVMLFLSGYSFGYYAKYRPIRMGLIMMLVGTVLVMITIALGG